MKKIILLVLILGALGCQATASRIDYALMRKQVAALGKLSRAPAVYPAKGFAAEGTMKPVFFNALPWKGRPTRVFAWIGLPEKRTGKVPGVVLVHGGGGTAFKQWVKKWTDQGFAAIAIAVEGQTDQLIPGAPRGKRWKRDALGGPARDKIYGDAAEPLKDQWMYHAVADTILANSLLRSMPEVDPSRVGVCGISWGGVIAATAVGIDPRFAFGIPIYGCGDMAQARNIWGRVLGKQAVYLRVWDPLLRLPSAMMPLLWITDPGDAHFPLRQQQISYREASGPRMVCVPLHLRHGHAPAWNLPDSYAFAKAVVETGRPWAHEVKQEDHDGLASVEFETKRPVSGASLLFKRNGKWQQTEARMETDAGRIRASARIPRGTAAYYFNLDVGGLTLSSEFQTVGSNASAAVALTGFSWKHVPLYIHTHFSKRPSDAQIDFLANHSRFFTLTKTVGAKAHGSTEEGTAQTARRIVERDPAAKVLFYFNSFINRPGYEAFKTYRPEWTLRDAAGNVVTIRRLPRPDPSKAGFREWWSNVVAAEMKRGPLAGVFVDAAPQALSPGLAKRVGAVKARAIVAGLREMVLLTKRRIGPDKILLVNGTRARDFRQILDWAGVDGVMIEHFDAFGTTKPADIKADLDTMAIAAKKGKFVVLKAWPGFDWLDRDMMRRSHAELLRLARARITFPLACFLVAAQPGSYFCYSWGYTDKDGMFDSYPELEHRLGPPKGDAVWKGLTATRDFEHASVWVDIANHKARIDWH